MIECVIKDESVILILHQMVSSGHVIALAPINLPLAHNWESRINLESYFSVFSESIWRRYVANEIPVIESPDVFREICLQALDGKLSWVLVPSVVVDSSKLTLDACCQVEQLVILVNEDVAPVRYLDGLFHFLKYWEGHVELKMDHNLWIGKSLHV